MSVGTLYISHKNHDWTGHLTTIIHSDNFKKILNDIETKDYHTSMPDLHNDNLQEVINASQKIVVIDINFEFIKSMTDDIFQYGYLLHLLLAVKEKVNGISWIEEFNYQKNSAYNLNKKSQQKQTLWTAGCSFTYGVGVSPTENYGSLLAEKLNLAHINIAKGGSSIFWAADQILRSDIEKDDMVILGLTTLARLEYSYDWELKSMPCSNADHNYALLQATECLKNRDLEYYDSQTHILLCTRYILQVMNFCNKIGAKFYLVNLLEHSWMPVIFKDYPNFIDLISGQNAYNRNNYIDLGTDNLHPGPMQHKSWADTLYKFIKNQSNH